MAVLALFSLPNLFSKLVPKSVLDYFHKKFEHWLSQRIPCQREHSLNSRNIMIYPTRFGLCYLGFVVLVFLLGTNYQNNIILLFSYLLASLFITIMFHSFYNFSQLRFQSQPSQQGYVEEILYFPINIMANKPHYDINIHFTDKTLKCSVEKVEQCVQGLQTINLAYKSSKRGKHFLGRVTVFSEYSLGFFKSKTVLNFGHFAIVYPKAKSLVAGQYQLSGLSEENNTIDSFQTANLPGTDDFSELKGFVQGESKSRTAWKLLAKGQGHYSKHYQGSQGDLQWLKLSEMPGNDIETKLSYLSFLVSEFSATNQTFGLQLYPENITKNIVPNIGIEHQAACLTALALYS
ncbi:DUF58 domain-containing protein [Colwellia echini]|uniref:DUF58 domain-containing protein n=1 Tax=Colwellia echini TaxID=1982103 RepID=A0ABY3MTP9_9GAMM|nr:DUF58 domain-containing protein [Colwellia echini]TYK64560.1 DUF58 domain-containing protein [Colwellia echini]